MLLSCFAKEKFAITALLRQPGKKKSNLSLFRKPFRRCYLVPGTSALEWSLIADKRSVG